MWQIYYCMMPSAPMKAFFDLFFTNWLSHKPNEEMFKKRAVVIPTAAGAGAGKANKLASNLSREKSVKVGIRTRFLFWFYGGMQKANWGASPSEKEYWESRGWLNGVKPWR